MAFGRVRDRDRTETDVVPYESSHAGARRRRARVVVTETTAVVVVRHVAPRDDGDDDRDGRGDRSATKIAMGR